MKSSRRLDIGIAFVLLLLPLLWFAPQALGGKTLLPADNLFTFEPWQSSAGAFGVGAPHNALISDLILENYAWKSLIVEALRSGNPADVLWNPRLFAGSPFLAAGQQSALYPLSVLFYVLPIWLAYGLFTWLQLGLAALGMYVFARVLGQRRPAAVLAAVAYAFSGFFIVSVNFTMIIAAAAWLPLILAMIELVVRKAEKDGDQETWEQGNKETRKQGNKPGHPVPYVAAGAVLLGIQTLAGHVEITYYVLLVSAFYAAWRLCAAWRRLRVWQPVARLIAWLIVMVALGLALGAVQLLPLYELVRQSFRAGSASLQQIRDWAWPSRQIATFLLPDIFGNPSHHTYFDIWTRTWHAVTQNALGEPLNTIDWGVKNYVEGGNYLGLPTLLLAAMAVLDMGIGYWVLGKGKARAWTRSNRNPRQYPISNTQYPIPNTEYPSPITQYPVPHTQHTALFASLAILSLLFAFGTPLYAALYYLVPGWSQLHSAFRWVFPFTLSMAVLAGFGLDGLISDFGLQIADFGRHRGESEIRNHKPVLSAVEGSQIGRIARVLGWSAVLAGAGALIVVLTSVVVPGPFVGLGDRLLAWSFWADLAQTRGFANGAMAWSYEAVGLTRFGVVAVLAGVWLVWGGRQRMQRTEADKRIGIGSRRAYPLIRYYPLPFIVLLLLDLWLFGHGFNTAADPRLLDFKPPVVGWLQDHQDPAQPWRLTSFDAPDEKLLNANTAMPYGLEDVRGYDSIIPKQYVAYMSRIQRQDDLLYNRIAPIYTQIDGPPPRGSGGQPNYDALDSPLLRLLGVRYVVTTHTIPNAGYDLVYDAEVKVYENRNAFPRVFIVPEAVAAADQAAALDTLQTIDPAQVVVVEGLSPDATPPPASPTLREARISQRGNRELFVDVNIDDRGWLVLVDNYFEGWKAYLRPFGVSGEGVTATGESIETQLPIYRADGTFRTVYLPQAGQWTVRFVYSPRSLLLGIYTSFLAAVTLLLLTGWWAWGRYYREAGSEIGTVAKNSAVQVSMSPLSRGIDFAFAMLRLRVLSPAGEGSYAFAIAFYGVFEIVTRFGLGTLLTRDVALDRGRARRYLANVIGLRTGLWLISLPLMALMGAVYRVFLHQLTVTEAQAIAIFALALLFANIADAISAVFNAFEKMEHPAGIATAIAVAKVALGALVLLPPFEMGFVGLAGVSLVMNVVQVVWLYVVLRRTVLPPSNGRLVSSKLVDWVRAQSTNLPISQSTNLPISQSTNLPISQSISQLLDWSLQRHMLRESGPLMLNHLLASVFWRIDLWILKGFVGATAVGIFSAGVKYLDGLNVIPSYFTLAIFPLMSRYAQAGRESLIKAYRLAVQLLFILALPVAVFVTFAATPLIQILGGAAYLPDSATALRIMIWSIPIGFVNSVTQYVLIAVNQQRFLTRAFVIGVAFNGLANLIFVPRYGYLAAAVILIPAELSLFVPFYWAVRRYVTPMPWAALLGRPLGAALVDAGVVWGLTQVGAALLPALVAGFAGYVAVLIALGTFRGDDFAVIRARLPGRLGGHSE